MSKRKYGSASHTKSGPPSVRTLKINVRVARKGRYESAGKPGERYSAEACIGRVRTPKNARNVGDKCGFARGSTPSDAVKGAVIKMVNNWFYDRGGAK